MLCNANIVTSGFGLAVFCIHNCHVVQVLIVGWHRVTLSP